MCGELGLAKIKSSAWGIVAPQTLEYKGFGGEKARDLPRGIILCGTQSAALPWEIPVTPCH
jgi:hypothetical protein